MLREKTREKLFRSEGNSHQTHWEGKDPCKNLLSLITVRSSGRTCIVQEFANECDGFEVYVSVPSNNLNDTRIAMGIVDKES